LEIRVPNGVKISTCFHTGYFVQKQLSEFIQPSNDSAVTAQNKQDFDNYVADFCNGFASVLP